MTDERRGHAPTPPGGDDALDREIRRLLAVDPSPAFEARVRERVAAEPTPNGWRAGRLWMAFGTAAATAALVLAVAVPRLDPPAASGAEPAGEIAGVGDLAPPSSGAAARRETDRPVSDLPPPATAEPDTATGPAAADAPARASRDVPSRAPSARPPGPPRFTRVVFSPSETTALRRLLAQARDRQVFASAAAEPRTAAAVGEPPAELVIPLIDIEPPAESVIPLVDIEPPAELFIPPIAIEPRIAIEPLNVALLDTGADQ